MHFVRYADAPHYSAPGHSLMSMRRLQGREAGPSDKLWIGCSVVEPGGGTTLSASDAEKFYVVLDGCLEVTVETQGGGTVTETLRAKDSCRIAPGEARLLANRGETPATVLLVMAGA